MYDHIHQRCINSSEKENVKNIPHEIHKNKNKIIDVEKIDYHEMSNKLNHENTEEVNDNNIENFEENENDDNDNKISKKRNFGNVIESYRNRKADLSNKILPETFHNICQEFRRSGDFKAMVDFITKYGPVVNNFNIPV